jgi:hypothetical protein
VPKKERKDGESQYPVLYLVVALKLGAWLQKLLPLEDNHIVKPSFRQAKGGEVFAVTLLDSVVLVHCPKCLLSTDQIAITSS